MDVLNLNVSLKRCAFSRDVSDCEHPFSMDTRTQTFIVIHCLNMHSKGLNSPTFSEYILRVLSVWNDIFYGKWLYFWLQAIEWYLLDDWCINDVLCLNKNNYFFFLTDVSFVLRSTIMTCAFATLTYCKIRFFPRTCF